MCAPHAPHALVAVLQPLAVARNVFAACHRGVGKLGFPKGLQEVGCAEPLLLALSAFAIGGLVLARKISNLAQQSRPSAGALAAAKALAKKKKVG